jgi:hypothetical protein
VRQSGSASFNTTGNTTDKRAAILGRSFVLERRIHHRDVLAGTGFRMRTTFPDREQSDAKDLKRGPCGGLYARLSGVKSWEDVEMWDVALCGCKAEA